jgi:hypothetical protein
MHLGKGLAERQPRPVPSYFLSRPVSAWPNGAMTFSMSAGLMPIPVSTTATTTPPPSEAMTWMATRPYGGVNFTALESRLIRI